MQPKKTFIGCVEKGFAFLGIQWNRIPEIASESHEKHRIKLALRYAQNAPKKCIGDYLRRWNSWRVSVLKCCIDEPTKNTNFPCNNKGVRDEKIYWDIGTIA